MAYAPRQGDIIIVDFDPQSGREQKGRRPAVVVSNNSFHRFTGMAIVCPISNTGNQFPLHIPLTGAKHTTGAVLCQHIKCIDIMSRNPQYVESLDMEDLLEVMDAIQGFFE